jgi:hypothetical protein
MRHFIERLLIVGVWLVALPTCANARSKTVDVVNQAGEVGSAMAVSGLFSSLGSLYPLWYTHFCLLKSNFLSLERLGRVLFERREPGSAG